MNLLHEFDLARAPGFFNPGLERTVDPKKGEPALSGYGLEPVVLIAFGGFRSEIDVIGAIVVLPDPLGLAADSRELLAGLQHGARQILILSNAPRIL